MKYVSSQVFAVFFVCTSAGCGDVVLGSRDESPATPPPRPEGGNAPALDGGTGPADCGPTPKKLAAVTGALFVVQDASNLYTADVTSKAKRLLRIPKAGGEPLILVADVGNSNTEQVQGLAADDQFLYWIAYRYSTTRPVNEGAIYRVPLAGGAKTLVADNRPFNFYGNLVVANGVLFWPENMDSDPSSRGGRVARVAVAGGPVETIKSGPTDPVPMSVAVGGDHVYWTTETTENPGSSLGKKVMRAPTGGGDAEEVAPEMGIDDALATNANSVFYSAGSTDDGYAGLPFTGGSKTNLPNIFGVTEIVAEERFAYAIGGSSSALYRASLDGKNGFERIGAPTDDGINDRASLHGLAVDQRCVYWAHWDDGLFTIQK